MPSPCVGCHKAISCFVATGGKPGCAEWQKWFVSEWAIFNAYAQAHGIQPTTPPEEVEE